MNLYFLDGKRCVRTDDVTKAFNVENKVVAKDEINGVRISTVFLGMDHGFHGEPLLFETMIFGGEHDMYQERYSTYDQAEKGHKVAVDLVKASLN